MRRGLVAWLEERVNLTEIFSFLTHFGLVFTPVDTKRPLRDVTAEIARQPVPSYARGPRVLGLLAAILFGLEAVTGVLLAYYYRPTPEAAFESTRTIVRDLPFGWLLHQIHSWGAWMLVAVVVLRLLRLFWDGLYRAPRELLWITAVAMAWVALQLDFTGRLLLWDTHSYWSAVRGMEVVFALPVVGPVLAFLLGGRAVSDDVLIRFYVLHVITLPLLYATFIYLTFATIRRVGLAPEREPATVPATTYRDHLYTMSILVALAFGALVTLAVLAPFRFSLRRRPLLHAHRGAPAVVHARALRGAAPDPIAAVGERRTAGGAGVRGAAAAVPAARPRARRRGVRAAVGRRRAGGVGRAQRAGPDPGPAMRRSATHTLAALAALAGFVGARRAGPRPAGAQGGGAALAAAEKRGRQVRRLCHPAGARSVRDQLPRARAGALRLVATGGDDRSLTQAAAHGSGFAGDRRGPRSPALVRELPFGRGADAPYNLPVDQFALLPDLGPRRPSRARRHAPSRCARTVTARTTSWRPSDPGSRVFMAKHPAHLRPMPRRTATIVSGPHAGSRSTRAACTRRRCSTVGNLRAADLAL
jgi:hypothetical protein